MPDLMNMPDTDNPTSALAAPRPAAAAPAAASSAPAVAAAGAGAAAATPALPAGVSAAPAPVTPAAAAAQPQGNPNFGQKVLHAILGALGGTEDVSYSRDASGNMVVSRTKVGTGQAAKRIIAGALTGMAAGSQVEPGPGHLGRAFGAGFDANSKRLIGQDQQKRQQADQDFQNNQEVLKNKATMAHLSALTTQAALESKRLGVEINDKLTSGFTALQTSLKSDPANHELGTFGSFQEFLNSSGELQQQVAKQMPHGLIRPLVHPDGSVTAYAINEAWDNQKLDRDMPLPVLDGFDKAGKPIYKNHTVAAGTATNGEYNKWMMGTYVEQQKVAIEAFKEREQNKRSASGEAAAMARTKLVQDREDARAEAANDTKETIAGSKVSQKAIDTNNKNYVKPANDIEKSFQMMSGAYQDYLRAKAQGKELPTGAQSMLALSTHLATTFGNVKGARITKDMIEHHLGARGITDSAVVAINKLRDGDVLSPDQWGAFNELVGHSRRLSWETAVKEATRAKAPIDFVPTDLHDMAEQVSAPKGATSAVWSEDGRTLLGHIVGGKYVALLGGK